MNFVIYLLPRGLLLLNLTEWWLVIRIHHPQSGVILWSCDHVKSLDERKTFYLQSHKLYESYQILTTFKKFIRWGYFIPEALSYLPSFHEFIDEYLCGPSCFKTSDYQSEKSIADKHYSQISDQEFKYWSTRYLELIIKDNS